MLTVTLSEFTEEKINQNRNKFKDEKSGQTP